MNKYTRYVFLSVLIMAVCAGFYSGFEAFTFLSLISLGLFLAFTFWKQLFYFLLITMPLSFELIYSSKNLLPRLTGGVNGNGLPALLLVSTVLPVIAIKAFKAGWRPSRSLFFLSAYIVWAGYTISFSEFPQTGFRYTGYLVYPLVFFVFVKLMINDDAEDKSKVFKWLLAGAVISAFTGYLLFLFDFHFISMNSDEFIIGTAVKRFRNPLGYGSSHWGLSMGLCALIASEAFSKEVQNKIFYIISLLICYISMALTYTRIPFVIVTLFLIFFNLTRKKICLCVSVCVIAVAFLIFTPMGLRFSLFGSAVQDMNKAQEVMNESKKKMDEKHRQGTLEREEEKEPTRLDDKRYLFQTAMSGRGVLLISSFNLALDSPFWGYGLGTADYKLNMFLKKEMGVTVPLVNVHSVIMRTRIETGYLGTGLYLMFVIALFIELVQGLRMGNRYAALGLLVFFYYCIGLLIEPVLSWYRFSGSIFFIVFAVALSKRTLNRKSVSEQY